MARRLLELRRSESAAVAPTVALSLFALVAVGGIAFDYARMAGMDSELQNAADQAALAAATQLDGNDGACRRAIEAAATRLDDDAAWLANETRFANDGAGLPVDTVDLGDDSTCAGHPNVRFWQDEGKTAAATGDDDANFAEVTVRTRRAKFALTPLVATFSSGDIAATAMAGMQNALCRISPMMMCIPAGSTAADFDGDEYAGRGLLLKARGGGNSWAPGDFGFLAAGYDSGGANTLRRVLGQEQPVLECVADSTVTTEPGNMEAVVDALNTRFDIYEATVGNSNICGNGQCPPDANTRSDLIRPNSAPQGSNCRTDNNPNFGNDNTGWSLPPADRRYFAETANNPNLASMGYPRDRCHASAPQSCAGGRIGDGVWDATAFFRTNYGWGDVPTWTGQTGLTAGATRYDVYRWELTQSRAPRQISSLGVMHAHSRPICQASPSALRERRRMNVAVVDCSGLNGRETLRAVGWIDVFLLEPSIERRDAANAVRTRASDVYVEIIGNSRVVGQESDVLRSVPYLVQ